MKHTGWAILVVTIAACGGAPHAASSAVAITAPATETVVPWSRLALHPAGPEHPARGPSAIAVDGSGRALVLDNWGRRVVDAHGDVVTGFDGDGEDVVAFADGAFAVYRPLARGVEVYSPRAEYIGALKVPRAVADVGLLETGPSRRVLVENQYQETVLLGSPAAPLDEASVLRSRKEGVHGGLEVVALGEARQIVLRVVAGGGDRKHLERQLPLGQADAALLVGRTGSVACARLETLGAGEAVKVTREAVCVDVESGKTTLRVALPAPGLYVPRRELAVGGGKLVMLSPQSDGAHVLAWEVLR